MKAFGSQIIAELISCQSDKLSHCQDLEQLLRLGIERFDLELKSIHSHQFEPVGVTVIAIIGASHVALHTYPEDGHVSVDIFTCTPGNPGPAQLLAFLKEQLQARWVRSKELIRGQGVDVAHIDYITGFTRNRFEVRYQIQRDILQHRSAYQQIRIIEHHDFGTMLFLDNELQTSSLDAEAYAGALLQPLRKPLPSIHQLAILGGGDGSVLQALLKYPVQQVHLAEIDAEVIRISCQYLPMLCGQAFEDPRVQIHIVEASDFLASQRELDGMICDLSLEPERLANSSRDSYYPRLFAAIYQSLKPGGWMTMALGSALDQETLKQAEHYLSQYFQQIELHSVWLPSFASEWTFGHVTKSET